MYELILKPLPWYAAGPLIGLIVPLLLYFGNKNLGISSSLRHICAAAAPGQVNFFRYNWRAEMWNLFFVGGILIGGILAAYFLTGNEPIAISEATKSDLAKWRITNFAGYAPAELFGADALSQWQNWLFFIAGGFLVGFGTRYAGGCTSGHAIMGLSNLQWPSLVAVIGFFVGGLIATHLLMPLFMGLL